MNILGNYRLDGQAIDPAAFVAINWPLFTHIARLGDIVPLKLTKIVRTPSSRAQDMEVAGTNDGIIVRLSEDLWASNYKDHKDQVRKGLNQYGILWARPFRIIRRLLACRGQIQERLDMNVAVDGGMPFDTALDIVLDYRIDPSSGQSFFRDLDELIVERAVQNYIGLLAPQQQVDIDHLFSIVRAEKGLVSKNSLW